MRKAKTHNDLNLFPLNKADFWIAARKFAQQACASFGASVPIPSSAAGHGDNDSSTRTISEITMNSPLSSIGMPISDSTSKSMGTAPSSTTTTSIPTSSTPVAPTTTQPSRSATPISWGISIRALRWKDLRVVFVAFAFVVDLMP